MRIPIYQMTFGQNEKGNIGLIFASEQEGFDQQSILFTIPVTKCFRHPHEFFDFLKHNTIYFPFLLGKKYYDLAAKVDIPKLVFTIPEKNIKVAFEIDGTNFYNWPFRSYNSRKNKYIGNQDKLILKNDGFLILIPIDLYEMDELFNASQGVFVGLTPKFGSFDNEIKQA